MRKIIIIFFLFHSVICLATNYHFSNSGNDISGNGSIANPYQTIIKANSLSYSSGDSVVFKKGNTFYGTLIINRSNIIYGAYGTGEKPIITGFSTLTSWTSEGGNIYSKNVSVESKDSIIVSVDGLNTAIGRFPNSVYSVIDSHSTNITLTDTDLDASEIDWTGAEVVIRLTAYIMERLPISNHTSSTLTFDPAIQNLANGNGYFIQNDLKTLDTADEWYYGGGKFYIYGNPSAKTIKISTLKFGCTINGYDYVTIDNLNFIGFGANGIDIKDADYLTIKNCDLSFCGEKGISGSDKIGGSSSNYIFDLNTINTINDCGILVTSQFMDGKISNNTISNIGLLPGATYSKDVAWSPYIYSGIVIHDIYNHNSTIVEYNSISDIGYDGIMFRGKNNIVRYNFIDRFCKTLTDGGGIYTSWDPTGESDPRLSDYFNGTEQVGLIYKNIVLNGISNIDGSPGVSAGAVGIYTDSYTFGITVDGNTVSNGSINSFFINSCRRCIIKNNTFYNSPIQLCINKWTETGYWNGDSIDIHKDLRITNNILFSKSDTQYCYYEYIPTKSGFSPMISLTMVLDSNYYVRPIKDDDIFWSFRDNGISYETSYFYYTLNTWKTYRGDDVNSHISPNNVASLSDIHFYYNPTKTDSIVSIANPYIDSNGMRYGGRITLSSYSSVILIPDPNGYKISQYSSKSSYLNGKILSK